MAEVEVEVQEIFEGVEVLLTWVGRRRDTGCPRGRTRPCGPLLRACRSSR